MKITSVEPREIPEVIEFLDASDTLKDFKEQHAEVFAHFDQLIERYNAALQQADQVCRTRKIKCGPFDLYQFSVKYKVEALYNAVGRDVFLAIGGAISTQTVYELDKGKFEAAVAQNKVTKDVVDQVKVETPSYHKPEPLRSS